MATPTINKYTGQQLSTTVNTKTGKSDAQVYNDAEAVKKRAYDLLNRTGFDTTELINKNQDADIAAASRTDVPSRDSGEQSLVKRYSTAFSEIGDVLRPGGMQAPTAPSFEAMYSDMRKNYGLDGLEQYVNDLSTEEEEIFATLRQRRTAERDKPVATNVIEGRISQTERQEAERIDYVRRQKQTAINELQSANATIENIMNLRQMDYNNARQSYNDAFSQQMTMFSTIKGIVDTEMTMEQRAQETARANLNIIYGAITEGTMDKSSMTPEMQYQVSKMELSAGLPQNFYNNLQNQNPGGKILSTTTRTSGGGKYADVLMQQPDGSIKVQSVYLGGDSSGSGGGTNADGTPAVKLPWEQYLKLAQDDLQMTISPTSDLFNDLKAEWQKEFGATPTKYTATEIKKLEQAGLLYADRQAQLDYLYGEDEKDERSAVDKLAEEYGVEI